GGPERPSGLFFPFGFLEFGIRSGLDRLPQRTAAAGDRGRHASRATAGVGARPSDVPDKAGPVPHLPMNILLGGLLAVAAADTLWLQNARMRLGFDSSNGSLFALTDRPSGQSFVDGRQTTAIWRLDRFGPGDLSVVPSSARRC